MKKLLLSLAMLSGTSAMAADELHLYNWNNYIAPETVKQFESECKCKLVQDYYGSMEEMLAKLAAGAKGYDLLVPTGFALEPLLKQGKLAGLDKARLPNLKNISRQYLDTAFDKGNQYSVPYAFTTTIIGYNDARLKEAGVSVDGWATVFDPKVLQKIKGKVTVLDDPREVFVAALKYLGYPANSTDEAQWKAAQQVILQAKPYWAAFNSQSYIKELTVGNIWVAHGYSNDFFQANQDTKAAKRPFSIVPAIPKEGASLSLDSMVLLKNAPRPDLAYKFVNFMLEGKNSAVLTNMTGSGNPNSDALKYVKPELTKMSSVFPSAAQSSKLEMLKDQDAKTRRLMNRMWTEIKVK